MKLRGLLIGLLAGAFGGLAGLGGGVIMVPLMTLWAGVSQHRAHGTSLLAVIFTGVLGAWSYAAGGAVAWRTAILIAGAAILGSLLAARFSARVPAHDLRRLFAYLVIFSGLLLPFKGGTLPTADLGNGLAVPATLLMGAFAGGLAGLLGVGGGSIVVPLLVLLLGFDQHLAQGTSLVVMIPAAVSGTLVHASQGRVDFKLAPGLVIGVAAGAFFGARLALGLPEGTLRLLFSVLLVGTGFGYLRTTRRG